MNRRGMFFMILAMVLIAFFLIAFSLFAQIEDRTSVERRVTTLNNFVFAAEEDLQRRVFISGFRGLFLFENYITQQGEFVDDVARDFDELFYNGTLYGVEQSLMQGARFSDIEELLREKAAKIGAHLNMSDPSVVISQDDPWHVRFVVTSDFLLEDAGELVVWNKTLTSEAFVPIRNFGDPLYSVQTNSLVFGNITQTPYSEFVVGGDTSNLLSHVQKGYYVSSSEGVRFLDRLEGNFVSSAQGIESLVDFDRLVSLGLSVEEKSVIDHEYFSSNNPSYCSIQEGGMPSWFRISTNRASDYNVTCV